MTDDQINNRVGYEMHTLEEPYDEYEKTILDRIEMLKREYQKAIEPWVKLLTESRSLKCPKIIMVPKEKRNE